MRALPDTTHVPIPTSAQPIRQRERRTGLDWSSHTAPKIDPVAIERLTRLGVLTVTPDVIDERPVKVVAKTKPKKRKARKPARERTHGAGWAKPTFDVDEAWRLYQTGLSTRDVGVQLGVTGQTIRAQLLRAGYSLREPGGGMPRIDVDEAIRLAEQGLTLSQIARALDASPSGVRTHLHRAGITPRDGRQDPRQNVNFRPDLDDDTIAAEYQDGATIPELAAKYEAGTRTIRMRLLKAGVTLRDDRRGHSGGHNKADVYTSDEIAEATRLYEAGRTMKQIADHLGRSESGIHRVLTRAGIQTRSSGEAQRGRPGRDNARRLRALMSDHGITSADVRAWATATGRPCPPTGTPSTALVEAYLQRRPERKTA